MNLIVGLGNPGKYYADNRHNIGFRSIDYFAKKHGISLNQRRARSQYGTGTINGSTVILAKPKTYMNLSGEAVGALVRYYKISLDNLLIIYDDLALPLGQLRIRERGSSGGHKGMKSIISDLGSQECPRIRIGIDNQANEAAMQSGRVDTIDYVLGNFSAKEKPVINEVYPKVADAIYSLITDGITVAMNKYNSRSC